MNTRRVAGQAEEIPTGSRVGLGPFTYLFVYDSQTRVFVERFWVKGAPVDPSARPPEAAELDGVVRHKNVEATMARLRSTYPPPRYAVSRMTSGSWSFVEGNSVGLYYH